MVLEARGRSGRFAEHTTFGLDDRHPDAEVGRQARTLRIQAGAGGPRQDIGRDPGFREQALRQRVGLVALDRDGDVGDGNEQDAHQRGERRPEELED
jgi:hypothetical protein